MRKTSWGLWVVVLGACSSGNFGTGGLGADGGANTDQNRTDGSIGFTPPDDGLPRATCEEEACEAFCDRMGETASRCDGVTCVCAAGAACTKGVTVACAVGPASGLGVGQCASGTASCMGEGEFEFGTWGLCEGSGAPTAEICDGEDNDCNGVVDDGLDCQCSEGESRECGTDEGSCEKGEQQCVDGKWTACSDVKPQAEICDGVDNDCDGTTDLGCQCVNGETMACGKDTGECRPGVQECIDGEWSMCRGEVGPTVEICDGKDNDCDGQTDPGCQCITGRTRPCGSDVGECRKGTQLCVDGRWAASCTGEIRPSAEICDGKDNDCNGQADEGVTKACGSDVGECQRGRQQCIQGVFQGACLGEVGPSAEICDGKDNNCNGQTDELAPRSCGTDVGICTRGQQMCVGGRWSACSGVLPRSTDACFDNLDNNCNGQTDEGCPTGELACGTPHIWMAIHDGTGGLSHSDLPANQCTTTCSVRQVSSSRQELTCRDTNLWTPRAPVEAAAVDLIPLNPRDFRSCLVAWGLHAMRRIDLREESVGFPRRTVQYLDATAFFGTTTSAAPLRAGGFETTLPAFVFRGSYVGPAPERDSGTPIFMYGREPSAPLSLRSRLLSRTRYQPAVFGASPVTLTTYGALLDYVYGTEYRESRFVIPIEPGYYANQFGHGNFLFVSEAVCERLDGTRTRQVSAIGVTEEPHGKGDDNFPVLLP